MPSDPERLYWDSCVYISCIQETPGKIETLRKIVARVKNREAVFVASTLVLAEVNHITEFTPKGAKKSKARIADDATKIQEFFENEYIHVKGVTRHIAERARSIARDYNVLPPDAIHIATAIEFGCHCFHTYDGEEGGPEKLLAKDGRIGTPPLAIKLPSVPVVHKPGYLAGMDPGAS